MVNTLFFNVGHGEAISILVRNKDASCRIIRDFGRSRSAQVTSSSITISEIPEIFHGLPPLFWVCRQCDAVLSHAHEDHYNGFEEIERRCQGKFFNNSYIPMFRMDDLNALGGVLVRYSLLLYRFLNKDSKDRSNARNWLRAAPVMARISRRIWCVNAGYSVGAWGKNRVLWPPLGDDVGVSSKLLSKKIKEFYNKNEIDENFLLDESERIRLILSKIYREDAGPEFKNNEAEGYLREIEEVLSKVANENNDFQHRHKGIDKLNRLYRKTVDNHSLMFEVGDEGKEHLYLSDADDATIGKMLQMNSISNKKYKLIKAAHHGNRGSRELCKHQITSKKVVMCCGPSNSRYRGPSQDYSCISANLICTDWDNRWPYLDTFIVVQRNWFCR